MSAVIFRFGRSCLLDDVGVGLKDEPFGNQSVLGTNSCLRSSKDELHK
jgi:hypothetical protein